MANFDQAIARIYKGETTNIVGAGCLLANGLILTCAHVVCDALQISRKTFARPNGNIQLDFPFGDFSTPVSARIVNWYPKSTHGRGDIALLQVNNSLDFSERGIHLKLYRLDDQQGYYGKEIKIIGFPYGYEKSVTVKGIISGKQTTGHFQIDAQNNFSYFIDPGFSGAPAWDLTTSGILGIVVRREMDPKIRSAFLIPTEILINTCPNLFETLEPSIKNKLPPETKLAILGGVLTLTAAVVGSNLDNLGSSEENEAHRANGEHQKGHYLHDVEEEDSDDDFDVNVDGFDVNDDDDFYDD